MLSATCTPRACTPRTNAASRRRRGTLDASMPSDRATLMASKSRCGRRRRGRAGRQLSSRGCAARREGGAAARPHHEGQPALLQLERVVARLPDAVEPEHHALRVQQASRGGREGRVSAGRGRRAVAGLTFFIGGRATACAYTAEGVRGARHAPDGYLLEPGQVLVVLLGPERAVVQHARGARASAPAPAHTVQPAHPPPPASRRPARPGRTPAHPGAPAPPAPTRPRTRAPAHPRTLALSRAALALASARSLAHSLTHSLTRCRLPPPCSSSAPASSLSSFGLVKE